MSGILSNVQNNASFALKRNAEAMSILQEQAATGSRINRASDAPSAAFRVLGLKSEARNLATYIENIDEAISSFEISSSAVTSTVEQMRETKTLLTQIMNGTYDEQAQMRIADGVNDILEQVVSLANTKHSNQYLFGGSNTQSAPYHVQRENRDIVNVNYQGSLNNRQMQLAPGVTSNIMLVGREVFHCNQRSEPVFIGETGAQAGSGTSNVQGDTWLTVIHDGSNYKISIDDGESYVTVPDGGEANQAVTHSETGEVLYVDTTNISSTGTELVRVSGTYSVFETLISIRDILKNERGLSSEKVQQLAEDSVSALEEVNNQLLQTSTSVGAKINFLEKLKGNLEDIKFNNEERTTSLQEADIAQISIDITQREVLYQISIAVVGKMMSTSLLNYIS